MPTTVVHRTIEEQIRINKADQDQAITDLLDDAELKFTVGAAPFAVALLYTALDSSSPEFLAEEAVRRNISRAVAFWMYQSRSNRTFDAASVWVNHVLERRSDIGFTLKTKQAEMASLRSDLYRRVVRGEVTVCAHATGAEVVPVPPERWRTLEFANSPKSGLEGDGVERSEIWPKEILYRNLTFNFCPGRPKQEHHAVDSVPATQAAILQIMNELGWGTTKPLGMTDAQAHGEVLARLKSKGLNIKPGLKTFQRAIRQGARP